MTAPTDMTNGTNPTENTSFGETGVNANNSRKGTRLATTANILQFKICQYFITFGHIIINRNYISENQYISIKLIKTNKKQKLRITDFTRFSKIKILALDIYGSKLDYPR